jgi:hypothetical protein
MLFAVVLFGSRPLPSDFIGRLYLLYTEQKDQEIGWEGNVMGGGGQIGRPQKTRDVYNYYLYRYWRIYILWGQAN